MDAVKFGNRIRVKCTFKNDAGVLTNPTTVTLTMRTPAGVVSTPEPVNDSPGIYHYDPLMNQSGKWRFVFEGVGVVDASDDIEVPVRPRLIQETT